MSSAAQTQQVIHEITRTWNLDRAFRKKCMAEKSICMSLAGVTAYCPFLRLDIVLLLAFCCVENISTCLPGLFEHAKKSAPQNEERKLWGVIKLTVDKKSIKIKGGI